MLRLYLTTLPLLVAASGIYAQDAAPADPSPADPTAQSLVSTAYVPMSAHERWHGYLHENLLSTRFAVEIFGSALVSHISRDPQEWGMNARGYFHRVENRFLDAGVDGAVHSSLAAALHEDTRYWRYAGDGRGLHRVGRAIARTFVTDNDAGLKVADVSGLAGIYSGSMAATYWAPHHGDVWGRGFRAGNAGLIGQIGANLFKEFGPDLKRLVIHK
jgi:hypothetical protein